MLRFSAVLLVVLGAVAPASASWANAMFEEVSKDFGSVPRGPTLTHYFRLKNNTNSNATISGVRVSCGCVTATALQANLAPGESTSLQALMDTRRFHGHKSVTIYVQFSRPNWEEARLVVQANARDDIHVTPETFSFGAIKRGMNPTSSVTMNLVGGSQWQITELQRESNYVELSSQEVKRGNGEVAFQITAKLKPETPVGKWFTDVWVKTNNPAMQRVRIPLTVEVESPLSVTPSPLAFGQIKSGEEAERKVIVRGVKPFKIKEVKGLDSNLTLNETNGDSKPIHVLTLKLKGLKSGDFERSLRIVTDLPEEGEVELQAKAHVVKD